MKLLQDQRLRILVRTIFVDDYRRNTSRCQIGPQDVFRINVALLQVVDVVVAKYIFTKLGIKTYKPMIIF